jgi:hypothetical protein
MVQECVRSEENQQPLKKELMGINTHLTQN